VSDQDIDRAMEKLYACNRKEGWSMRALIVVMGLSCGPARLAYAQDLTLDVSSRNEMARSRLNREWETDTSSPRSFSSVNSQSIAGLGRSLPGNRHMRDVEDDCPEQDKKDSTDKGPTTQEPSVEDKWFGTLKIGAVFPVSTEGEKDAFFTVGIAGHSPSLDPTRHLRGEFGYDFAVRSVGGFSEMIHTLSAGLAYELGTEKGPRVFVHGGLGMGLVNTKGPQQLGSSTETDLYDPFFSFYAGIGVRASQKTEIRLDYQRLDAPDWSAGLVYLGLDIKY